MWPRFLGFMNRKELPPQKVTLHFRAGDVDEITQHEDRVGALKAADEYLKKASGHKTINIEIH